MCSSNASHWREAEQRELKSLRDFCTSTPCFLPRGESAVGSRWVYTRKPNGDFKARLVAQGFSQRPEDIGDTYASVIKLATLRALLAVAAAHGLILQQFDVNTAFLHSPLEEQVFMRQPPGYATGPPGTVWRLHKALYGLKQSPRAWHSTLRARLLEAGFTVAESDPSMFVMHSDEGRLLALVYVDDGIVGGVDAAGVQRVLEIIQSCFDVRLLGEPSSFIGLQISRDLAAGTLKISQERATLALVDRFAEHLLPDAARVPMDPAISLQWGVGLPMQADESLYPQLVGCLMHIAMSTRPDIAHAVGTLARYTKAPMQVHWLAALQVLRYLRGTASHGITYGRSRGLQIYCDSDFAGCPDTRRSTTGACVVLHGGVVDYSTRLQPTVAVSSCEAEYQAASAAVRMALWQRKLLPELGLDIAGDRVPAAAPAQVLGPVLINCDNQGAIALLRNPQSTARSKHIDVIHHFARERVLSGEVEFVYCRSADNLADCFTKSLTAAKLAPCLAGLGVG
jgi:hypothetical protein